MANKKQKKAGGMSQLDMLLSLVCAIFFLDTIASVSTMGWAAITWTIIVGALFFFPGSLSVAELGAAYPEDGGFAGWTRRAFGAKMGARMGYVYWACNAVWLSSNATLFINVFQQVFNIQMGKMAAMLFNLAIIWIQLLVLMLPSQNQTAMFNYGAIVKIIIGIGLVIAGIAFVMKMGAPANEFSVGALKPTLGDSIVFIPALIYNFLGFETSSANGTMENPGRDVPKAALKNVLLVSGLYIITVIAMLCVLPINNISIIGGIIDTFRAGFGNGPVMNIIIIIIGVLFLSVLFIQGMLWVGAPCNTAAIAGESGELPKIFTKRNKHGSPIGVLIISGVMATLMTFASNLMSGSAEEMFWAIFSCTSFLLLIPYLVNFQAYLKLKKTDKTTPRPYVFPGPSWLSVVFTRIGQLIVIATMILFVWTPGVPINVTQFIFVIVGVVIILVLGEILLKVAEKQNNK